VLPAGALAPYITYPSMDVSNCCSCGGGELNAMRSEPLQAVFHPPSAGTRCSASVVVSFVRFSVFTKNLEYV
jgi:hypothetical protein